MWSWRRHGFIMAALALAGCDSARQYMPRSTISSEPEVNIPLVADRSGLAYVDANINGRGPYRLLLDTGAGGLFLSRAAVKDLDLHISPLRRVRGSTAHGTLAIRAAYVDRLEMKGVSFRGQYAGVIQRDSIVLPGVAVEAAGVLGLGVFVDTLLRIDFPRRQMIVSTGALPSGGLFVIPTTRPRGGMPRILISVSSDRIGPYEFEAVLDSGANVLHLPGKALDLPIPKEYVGTSTAYDLLGAPNPEDSYRLGVSVRLGDGPCGFDNPTVRFVGEEARVGVPILSQLIVIFDQKHNRVAVVPDLLREQLQSLCPGR